MRRACAVLVPLCLCYAIADGAWTIQLKDVRDDIGNFYDSNPGTEAIEHYEWNLELW